MSIYDAFDFENDWTNLDINTKKDFKELIEIRKKMARNFVKCLDDFQGEENEVIILSLTRSSDVGFLRQRNRSFVSLSRAKQMEIIVGNRSIFGIKSENSLWRRITSQLNYMNRRIIPHNGITVKGCGIHEKELKQLQRITSLEDLLNYRFNHCQRYCSSFLDDCNHQCQLTCHYHKSMKQNVAELFERRYYCPMKCENRCCKGHQCSGICGNCKRFHCSECQLCKETTK